jgi:hypothetical protein
VHRHLDVRILLVILEANVEARMMRLDEIGLEQQRLRLTAHHDRVDVANAAHHLGLFGGWIVRREMVAYARPERFGFADVQNSAPRVLEHVDAGPRRQMLQLLIERFQHGR